jgi:hypothetical protein
MMTQVINIPTFFLAFVSIYDHAKAHNMMAIMLDFHFKNMKSVRNFVSDIVALQIVIEYDINILSSFTTCFFL